MTYASLKPLVSRVRRRLMGESSLVDAAIRSWVVAPGCDTVVPSSIFPEGELQKVIGVPEYDSIVNQMALAIGGAQHHVPTIAHDFANAVLCDGHLYTSRLRHTLISRRQPSFAIGNVVGPSDAVLVTSLSDTEYFGHWMFDCLPRMLTAKDIGTPVSAHPGLSESQHQYLRLLGLEAAEFRNAYFTRITVLEDHGQTEYKRQRYAQLRNRARAMTRAPERNRGVMLLRGTSGVRRHLVNESEVMESVLKRGFRIIDPLQTPVTEIIAACLDADIVMGVEGSQLVHGQMWMSTTGTLLSIQPPTRFTTVLKDRCDCEGIRYAFLVGDPLTADEFSVDVNAVNRLLDRIESLPGRASAG